MDGDNLFDAAWHLADLLECDRSVLFRTEPEVPDFTSRSPFNLVICGSKKRLDLAVTPENIEQLVSILDHTIFDKDQVDRIYTWQFKAFATYFRFFCERHYVAPTASLIDLTIIENFLGIKKNRPENLFEAINRAKTTLLDKSWFGLYKPLYLPLALKVLPSIETKPLLNESTKSSQYPYYEIEGQANGRMNCVKKYAKCYLPHRLGPEERRDLKPRGYGLRFLTADFRHCEVTVLQWLTNDPKLKELIDSGSDLHQAIYETLTGDSCNSDKKRELSKSIFLPVIYGSGPSSLSKRTNLPENVCKDLIVRVRTNFRTAWDWMMSKQSEAKAKGQIKDHFGRPRTFEENQSYLARNFVVQGVAATACQEKLVDLVVALDKPEDAYVIFSVHDGFGVIVRTEVAKETYRTVKMTLEAESKLCLGLKMKVQIKFGVKLDAMRELWKD
jgi:hypothetical protein